MAAPTTTTTATKDEQKKPLIEVLGVDSMPLAELQKKVDHVELARAWAGGLIEFGHRQYCITGPVGKIGSALVLEDGFEWSGPKTKMHKPYRELINEQPPKVEKFKAYKMSEPKVFGEEPQLRPVEISQEEAIAAIAIQVRLTDKGLGDS